MTTSNNNGGGGGGNGSPAALGRSTPMRIAMPPISPNPNTNTASSGFGLQPVPQSPGGGTASSSRFGALNLGFRRNRGQSTSRDMRNEALMISTGSSSPPAFPELSASTSQPNLPQSNGPYFYDGDEVSGPVTNASASASTNNLNSSISTGARGYFSRRGFARKMTGGNRTPTNEAPPLLRTRSSSQPSLPFNPSQRQDQRYQPPNSANPVSGSFFPPQHSPSTPDTEVDNPLPEITATTPITYDNSSTTGPNPSASRPQTAGPAFNSFGIVTQPAAANPSTSSSSSSSATGAQKIRLVPHLDTTRSLAFDPVCRDVLPTIPLRIGRFTDRAPNQPASSIDHNRVAFKSKVVSRTHAEIWYDPAPPTSGNVPATNGGGWFIRDLKSSSGTFLNHIRLSGATMESRPYPLRDGDILQLGVDYQGGTEEIYKCVKMRVELNRAWQRGANSFK